MTNALNSYEFRLNEILLNISKLEAIDHGDLKTSFENITVAVANALSIERVSIWFYNDDLSSIVCAKLYETQSGQFSEGQELKAASFPTYFKFLAEQRTLLANEVRTNPATAEFLESYLIPLNVFSMLDAPIRVNGKMVGVICSEKTGELREWSTNDVMFLGNIADILARALQAQERVTALNKLKENNENLEKLIAERTVELEKQRAVSVHSSKMALLGEMAGSIAHEINNPLTIILCSIRVLKKMDDATSAKKESSIQICSDIEKTTLRIADIVKGLRFFARDAGRDEFLEVSLKQILDETLSLCSHQLRLSETKLLIEGFSEDMLFKCQSASLSQAFLNLIKNSYDAIKDLKEKWIKISCSEQNGNYVLKIQDSGKGIPEDIRDKIMLPFFTTKPLGQGTGLGLSITKGIIESHNGSFVLDEKSENTCFVLTLPKNSCNKHRS